MPPKKLQEWDIKSHLTFNKIRKCKKYSYIFVSKYKQLNPTFDEFELFGDLPAYENYKKWKEFGSKANTGNFYSNSRSFVVNSGSCHTTAIILNQKQHLSGSMSSLIWYPPTPIFLTQKKVASTQNPDSAVNPT